MSRPQKMHKPLKGEFNDILGAIAIGDGNGKKTALMLRERKKVTKKKEVKRVNIMRRAVNIFYQCAIGFVTIVLALGIYERCQGWHIRMLFAEISQPLAVANPDEKEQEQEKADTLAADRRILAIAKQKPFIAIMSEDEENAVKKARADLGISQ